MAKTDYNLGEALQEGLQEALAWKRGKIALEVRRVEPMAAERVKEIRKKVAKSTAMFEKIYGIPASTVNNWEQGRRKIDPAARLLFMVIDQDPDTVERAVKSVA